MKLMRFSESERERKNFFPSVWHWRICDFMQSTCFHNVPCSVKWILASTNIRNKEKKSLFMFPVDYYNGFLLQFFFVFLVSFYANNLELLIFARRFFLFMMKAFSSSLTGSVFFWFIFVGERNSPLLLINMSMQNIERWKQKAVVKVSFLVLLFVMDSVLVRHIV